jgi:hypothetical protein
MNVANDVRLDPEAEHRAAFVTEAQRMTRLAKSGAAAAAVRLVEIRRTSNIKNAHAAKRAADTASKCARAKTRRL